VAFICLIDFFVLLPPNFFLFFNYKRTIPN
jgi:hypothetical protein